MTVDAKNTYTIIIYPKDKHNYNLGPKARLFQVLPLDI